MLKRRKFGKAGTGTRSGLAGALLVSVMLTPWLFPRMRKWNLTTAHRVVPRSQEFRWSDGGLPQTFDPAFAAAPPDTDLVRAIFEGLTDYDAHALTAVPAVALPGGSPRMAGECGPSISVPSTMLAGRTARRLPLADFVRSWQHTLFEDRSAGPTYGAAREYRRRHYPKSRCADDTGWRAPPAESLHRSENRTA